MRSLGVDRLVVSKILNHAEAGQTKTYDRYSADPEKVAAMQHWAQALLAANSMWRMIELNEAHHGAIHDEPGADAFYEDGRHQELVELVPVVHHALGFKPWDTDLDERLAAALEDE